MTRNDLRILVDYHYWARDRVLDAAAALTPEQYSRDLASSFRSVRDTLVHIYSAECVWYQRWQGKPAAAMLAAEAFPDVDRLRMAWAEHEGRIRAFVNGVDEAGMTRVYEYKLMSGAAGSSPFWQMAQHVVNHATYHRGQVTTMFRQLGAAPGKSMDMIAYYRERPPHV
jgi:uncharacterized damage-inducible protein DinB